MKEIISILSGTFDFDDLVEEIVEAVEADDLLEVDTMSENWSQLFLSQVIYEFFVMMQICEIVSINVFYQSLLRARKWQCWLQI